MEIMLSNRTSSEINMLYYTAQHPLLSSPPRYNNIVVLGLLQMLCISYVESIAMLGEKHRRTHTLHFNPTDKCTILTPKLV